MSNVTYLYDDVSYKSLTSAGIPDYMHEGIIAYVNEGILPGSFLRAVISNNLKEAVLYADNKNAKLIANYVRWFYNNPPGNCWGSEEEMYEWAETKRKERGIE